MVRIGLWRACCRQGGREPLPRCRFMRHSGLDPRSPPVRFGAMSLLFLQLGHGAQRPDWLAVVVSPAGVRPHGLRGVFGFSRSSGCDRGKSRRANILRCHSPSNFLGRVGDGSHRRYRKNFWYGCLKIRAYQAWRTCATISYPLLFVSRGPVRCSDRPASSRKCPVRARQFAINRLFFR